MYNYVYSEMNVRLKVELSNSFPLNNGVKQRGCLSPTLFAKQ